MLVAAIWTILGGACFLASVFADYSNNTKLYRLFVSVGGFWTAMGVLIVLMLIWR